MEEIIDLEFRVIIVAVSAYGFSQEWLGREINRETAEALNRLNSKYGVSPVGEGGEYETLVLDAPFFKKRIKVVEADEVWEDESGYLLVKKAKLEEK